MDFMYLKKSCWRHRIYHPWLLDLGNPCRNDELCK